MNAKQSYSALSTVPPFATGPVDEGGDEEISK